MNTKFTVKNFRSFDEEGATFEIAPITLLTGCNSSGKSSLVKSMVLLSKFIQQMKDNYQKNGDCCPQRYPLGVTDVKLQLGNYTSILNKGAEKNGRVSLSYAIKPLQSDKEFVVTYTFTANKADRFNEGWLAEMTIETTEGNSIFHIIMEDNNVVLKEYNLKPLKNSFYYFSMVRLGCINGGGQPYIKGERAETLARRMEGLYAEDAGKPIRLSHENPDIKKLYAEYLGEPGSEKAHHLLHTVYHENLRG